jgi:multisubunit Na+/H+ antiporter MnhG subunit
VCVACSTTGSLISPTLDGTSVFVLGAFICAKARVAGVAVVFALIALVIFVSTPTSAALPSVVATSFSTVDRAATPAVNGSRTGG